MGPEMPNRRRKKRTHNRGKNKPTEEEGAVKIPKTFVLRKGEVGRSIKTLVSDIRQVMLPNTAERLKERRQNKLKDFVHIAGPLGVTHFMVVSTTTQGTNYLRVAKVPQGPTLTYRIDQYSLMKDIHNAQARPHSPANEFSFAPLVVMNGFTSQESHMKLVSSMWQSVFPAINVQKIKLPECKRVVLLDYDKESGMVEFRHYVITVVPHGVSKGVKRLVSRNHDLPNLEDYSDISEYINQAKDASESDVEDGPEAEVTIPDGVKSKKGPLQMAVRLVEMGPRMQLRLMKIQEGFCHGDVLYQHQEDTLGTGADSSLAKSTKITKTEANAARDLEQKRVETLAISNYLPKKRARPRSEGRAPKRTKRGADKKKEDKQAHRREKGAPQKKRFKAK